MTINVSFRKSMRPSLVLAVCLFEGLMLTWSASTARAQENYAIQVYAYDTVEPGHTMVELHSKFTFEGSKTSQDGMYPTNHQLHETIEITHGFTDWFETGFYIFTSEHNGQGIDWVGDHIPPRFRIPPKWKWPVGLSLSRSVTSGGNIPLKRGRGRCVRSSISRLAAGICPSILPSINQCMA